MCVCVSAHVFASGVQGTHPIGRPSKHPGRPLVSSTPPFTPKPGTVQTHNEKKDTELEICSDHHIFSFLQQRQATAPRVGSKGTQRWVPGTRPLLVGIRAGELPLADPRAPPHYVLLGSQQISALLIFLSLVIGLPSGSFLA